MKLLLVCLLVHFNAVANWTRNGNDFLNDDYLSKIQEIKLTDSALVVVFREPGTRGQFNVGLIPALSPSRTVENSPLVLQLLFHNGANWEAIAMELQRFDQIPEGLLELIRIRSPIRNRATVASSY